MKKSIRSEVKKIENKKITLFAVMKLSTEIEYKNPFTQEQITCKLGGLAGYIPVFSTIEEAEKSAENGKYEIISIES